jgi:hypothetical protein
MAEENIYSDGTVSVTTARIMIGGTTYALRNITSVRMTTTEPQTGGAIALVAVGAFLTLPSFVAFVQGAAAAGLWLLVLGIIIGGSGLFSLRVLKPAHSIIVASSAGEIRALTSPDKNYIAKIVSSINEAIVRYR